jgi:serine/threonine-protein kinase
MKASLQATPDGTGISVLAHFDRLLELTPQAQLAALQQLQRDDPATARQLATMLAADAHDSGMLDRPVAALLGDTQASDASSAANDRSGTQIGDYRLQERIGIGGMGEVYRALREHEGFTQEVALKLLRLGDGSPGAHARFLRERQILARLEHPGIARLIDGGVDAGTPWLAMELIGGETLTDYAQQHALDLNARVALIESIATAVDYAHRQLVVHRDLKPSNVLVDARGQPRLLDFGIAKLLDEAAGQQLTATDVRIMSPAYAAPEQIRGAPITIATDVYALGLLLYQLLVGELPHGRGDTSLAALAQRLDTHSVERPSARLRQNAGLRFSGARAIRGDLDIIVCKALATEPARRYLSAAAFAEDLQRWRSGFPIRARADTWRYRMGKFVRRNRVMAAASVLALLGLLAGLAIALAQVQQARAQAQRVDTVKQFLISMFAEGEALGRDRAQARTPMGIIEDAMTRAREQFADDPELSDSVLTDLAEVQINLGAASAALPELERAIIYRRAHYGDHDLHVADALSAKVQALFQLGRFPESEPLIEEASAIYRSEYGELHLDVVNMLNRMVRVRIAQTRYEDALLLMREVVRLGASLDGADSPTQGLRLSNLAVVLIRTGDRSEARQALEQSMDILERKRGPDHASLLFPLNTLGDLLRNESDYHAALPVYRRAAELAERTLGAKHPRRAAALNRLGDLQQRMGDLSGAEHSLRQALQIQEEGQFAEVVDTYSRMGDLAQRRDDPAAASEWFAKAHARGMQTQGARSLQNWVFLRKQGEALSENGEFAAARSTLTQAMTGMAALGADAHEAQLELRGSMGLVECAADQLDAAMTHFEQSQQDYAAIGKDDTSVRVWLAATELRRATDGAVERARSLLRSTSELPVNAPAALRTAFHFVQSQMQITDPQRQLARDAMVQALSEAGSSGRIVRRWSGLQ